MSAFYMVCSVVGYTHLVIAYGETIDEGRRLIAEDFGIAIDDVEYECTLTEFENTLD